MDRVTSVNEAPKHIAFLTWRRRQRGWHNEDRCEPIDMQATLPSQNCRVNPCDGSLLLCEALDALGRGLHGKTVRMSMSVVCTICCGTSSEKQALSSRGRETKAVGSSKAHTNYRLPQQVRSAAAASQWSITVLARLALAAPRCTAPQGLQRHSGASMPKSRVRRGVEMS